MNQFISPHQNININISYNIGQQEKTPKAIFGKKISKIVRSTYKDSPQQFHKTLKKNTEHLPKQQQHKKNNNKNNKVKKKSNNNLFTLLDQQIIQSRRLKTQGSYFKPQQNSVFKKQYKNYQKSVQNKPNSQHSKSLNNPMLLSQNAKGTKIKKQETNNNKIKKQQYKSNNKSCILYQTKKQQPIIINDTQHVISTTTNGTTSMTKQINQKKRINSANFITSNKFVNKLLDISVLPSQLGNSIQLKDDAYIYTKQKQYQSPHQKMSNSLQNYMNSIDLRIIKKMEQDNNQINKKSLKDMNIGQGLQLITFLNKIKRIPLQKLNEKANKIQKFWKKKNGQSIIPYYHNMFFNNPVINLKNNILNNFNDISVIDVKGQISDHFENSLKSVQSSNKNNQKNDLFQLVSPNIISPKTDGQNQQISTEKINKMFEVYSSIKNGKVNQYNNKIQKQENSYDDNNCETKKQIQMKKNEVSPSSQISNNEKELYKELLQEDTLKNNKNKSRTTNNCKEQAKPQIQKNKQQQAKCQRIVSQPPKYQSKQSSHLQQQQKPAGYSTNIGSDKNSRQSKHWNYVHNILSSNMNKKAESMPENVLQQLIKQSAYNKQWVEGEFSNSQSLKISQKISPRQSQSHNDILMKGQKKQKPTHKQQNCLKINQQITQNLSNKQTHLNEEQIINDLTDPFLQSTKISEQQDHYNWNKYSDISRLKKQQEVSITNEKKYGKDIFTKNNKKSENNDLQENKKQREQQEISNKKAVLNLLPPKPQKNIFSDQEQNSSPMTKKQQKQSIDQEINSQLFLNKYQKYTHNKSNEMQDSMEDLQNKLLLERDAKWIRGKNITGDNIVDKYLECGLDNFQLYLRKNNKRNVSGSGTANDGEFHQNGSSIEKTQQKQVEEAEQHKPIMEKQHIFASHPEKVPQQKPQVPECYLIEQIKQTHVETNDIQSKELITNNNFNEDKQLEQAFKNINSKIIDTQKLVCLSKNSKKFNVLGNRDLSLQHALKNNKRNDIENHLRFRPSDQEFPNTSSNKQKFQNQNKVITNQDKQLILPLTHNLNQLSKNIQLPQQWHQLEHIPLFQPSYKINKLNISQGSSPNHGRQQVDLSAQEQAIQQQINNKRIQKIAQNIILQLIQQFAFDVSVILRKTQSQGAAHNFDNQKQRKKSNDNLNTLSSNNQLTNTSTLGIRTNFQYIRQFITKLKIFIIQNSEYSIKVIQNLQNNIGPTSVEILSYLRIQQLSQFQQNINEQQHDVDDENNQQWLFVIPNDLFEEFNKLMLEEEEIVRKKKFNNKMKLYMEFWHRSIFQCYNECLDFERPFGILGAPYSWITQPKLAHKITYSQQKIKEVLENAQGRLLELSCSSSGIIFDKLQSPYRQFNLNEEQKLQLNEQKISRMLANQILDDQYNWISYNDEITELMVDISRKIQELLILQVSSDIKKIARRRKMIVSKFLNKNEDGKEDGDKQEEKYNKNGNEDDEIENEDQHVTFQIEDLS